jgi:hypothetical protein
MRRAIAGVLLGAALSLAGSADAAARPSANKLIALVGASGCEVTRLDARLDTAGHAMARDRRITRVSIDHPADPDRNLDLMGRPSPFAAAVEVSAPSSVLRKLGHRLRSALGRDCPVAVYLVYERRLMTTPRSWPLGHPSPTTKTLVTLERKSGVSFDTFDEEWAGPHAELALGWRAARRGDGHYVQNLVVGRIGDAPAIDGIGESEGPGAAPGPEEREARARTAAHAATFQNLASSQMFVARETVIKD